MPIDWPSHIASAAEDSNLMIEDRVGFQRETPLIECGNKSRAVAAVESSLASPGVRCTPRRARIRSAISLTELPSTDRASASPDT